MGYRQAGLWKLLTGTVEQAMYTGPAYPNSTTDEVSSHFVSHCGDGCLFELRADPLETSDLASRHPQRLARLFAQIVVREHGRGVARLEVVLDAVHATYKIVVVQAPRGVGQELQ